MDKTKIDWCDSTWNPVTGCLHGCEYCYARSIAERFGGKQKYSNIFDDNEPIRGNDGRILAYPHSFNPTFHRYKLDEYVNKKGRNIFVCSMADLFGDWVPDEWIEEIFKACYNAPQHNYLFLTKNPEKYAEHSMPIDRNMWYGTSVCRKDDLQKCKFLPLNGNKFISIEPILEDLCANDSAVFNYVDWIIIGAETGRRKDKVIPQRKWIEDIVNKCRKTEIPIFMKSSLAEIWGEPLIQEFPKELSKR